ncbi:hypothetical protein AAON49_00500 [Pseudotenacibaculum sp. MALMAid0570]|uniref:hypothetical protein n=1 Tax=Pseudotenacibaculum sp. MALMAid0570 TaxID=3143938 RepID=UPI0032DF7609
MDYIKEAQNTLNNKMKLIAFATANHISKEAAKTILERISKGIEYDQNSEKYIWDKSENEHLKEFETGRRIGFNEGNSIGKTKGRLQGVLITITLGIATFLGIKKHQQKK